MHVLYETASGYALFETSTGTAQAEWTDLQKFGKECKLVSFTAFKNAAHALENMMHVSEAVVNPHLSAFLELNLPKKAVLGVSDKNFAGAIKAEVGCDCVSDEFVGEVIRALRTHSEKMLKGFKEGGAVLAFNLLDLGRAQLGLGHSYSRAKVKFNVNRSDNMIIQAICLLDQLDKDVNTFSMRCKEWYGWHFPELVKIIPESALYAKLVKFIKNKADLSEESLDELENIAGDPIKAKSILQAARSSMGTDVSPIDLINILSFADRVISLTNYRANLASYLVDKMHAVAPNLSSLIGEVVGARLISHAGSLTNLAKYPASTVQILGAEKALFRALKTKGNTPKYGLIYHSTFIGRAAQKNKGRISRFLANKCSIASRIDHFVDTPTDVYGCVLRDQVEERLKFYEDGVKPRTNAEAMSQALGQAASEEVLVAGEKRKAEDDEEVEKKKKSKKAKKHSEEIVEGDAKKEKKSKKSKKEKTKKH